MKSRYSCRIALLLMCSAGASFTQASLPIEEVEFAPLKSNIQRLLQALDELNAPLPTETMNTLNRLLKGRNDPSASEEIQQLLDPYCLIGINVNPESRVKAARGDAAADLKKNQWSVVLIKIQNEAGVTQPLRLISSQLQGKNGEKREGRWLRATIHDKPPMSRRLSGRHIEYLVLRISSSEAGKREATLVFDVGQGTQDLGFRAEVPILFTVKE